VRQSSDDRALYYRQLRQTIHDVLLPELTSARATDAAALIDRILAEFIVEEESSETLSAEYGGRFQDLLEPGDSDERPMTAARFHELRGQAAKVVADAAGGGDAGQHALGRSLVEIERDFLERLDELRRVVLADGLADDDAPPPDACSVSSEQMTAYLRRRLADSPDVAVKTMTVIPGGRSKETVLVALTGAVELPDEVILRKDRPVSVLQTRAADEFAVIKAVHDFGGVPVPEPFFAEQEDHGLGDGTFLIMERVPGEKAGEYFPDLAAPTQHRREIGLHIAASLARLHSVPLDRLSHTSLATKRGAVTAESVSATVEAIVGRINELTGPPCATVPLARQWLLENVSDVAPAPRLCLLQGDFGFHNMLIDKDRVTALVDWEAASIGPPAQELAAAWNAATALVEWPTFVAAYVEAGGPVEATDPRAVAYYRVLSALGGFMTSRLGGHLFRTGAKRDLLTAHSGLDSHFRCARNLARALGDAMADSER
jgi:aminoglycoside phosphotransferase (APT) family kinase protein